MKVLDFYHVCSRGLNFESLGLAVSAFTRWGHLAGVRNTVERAGTEGGRTTGDGGQADRETYRRDSLKVLLRCP